LYEWRCVHSSLVRVGIVSAGEMGSAVGRALRSGGADVVTTLDGRSERTARLAREAGLECLPDLPAVARSSDVVLSIAPPDQAEMIAAQLAEARGETTPLVADLNAVAPATARRIESALGTSGLDLVDGSISGPPPLKAGTTRIYLSGRRAEEVLRLPFEGVELVHVGDEVGAASAVKMSTASVYKGTTAVLAQALLAAQANGVLDHVVDDLGSLADGAALRIARSAAKSGRYVGEMREIAVTQGAAGLTPELFEAMAAVYAALAASPLAAQAPEDMDATDLEEVLGEATSRAGPPARGRA
jgi:3-hydroxyisobutyrate dehydrogenase-like beta-hydroxyacid dehydrogenase